MKRVPLAANFDSVFYFIVTASVNDARHYGQTERFDHEQTLHP